MRNERHSQRLLGNINVLPDSHRRAIHVTSGLDTLYLAANLFCKGINPIEIVEGRLNAFFKENVLLEQAYVKDPSKTVGALFKEVGGKAVAFARVEVGKGEAE